MGDKRTTSAVEYEESKEAIPVNLDKLLSRENTGGKEIYIN